MAQWVCPGVTTGLKFILYSLARLFKREFNKNKFWDFLNQKIPGIQKITIKLLTQLILKFNHATLGSKIENKLFIILKKKF